MALISTITIQMVMVYWTVGKLPTDWTPLTMVMQISQKSNPPLLREMTRLQVKTTKPSLTRTTDRMETPIAMAFPIPKRHWRTNPNLRDTDSDGLNDGWEVMHQREQLGADGNVILLMNPVDANWDCNLLSLR